jgi:glutamine cyclotransferase
MLIVTALMESQLSTQIMGLLKAVIDLSSLIEKVQKHDNLDVLNGIAYNNATKTLFVTGKMWNKIFEIEIFKK